MVEQHPPLLRIRAVNTRLNEQAADTPADNFLLDELQSLVRLPRYSIGGEDQQDLDTFAGKELLKPIEARAPLFGAADCEIKEDVLPRNENGLLYGSLEQTADLVDD
jgi:hypothetical protein